VRTAAVHNVVRATHHSNGACKRIFYTAAAAAANTASALLYASEHLLCKLEGAQ